MKYDMSRWSKNAVALFGLPDEYMFNAGSIWEKRIHPDDIEVYHNEIENIFDGKADEHDMQYRAMTLDGEYIICTCRGVVLFDENKEPEYFAGSITNHSVQNDIDTLTGLSNQYGFLESLNENMIREKRWKSLFSVSESLLSLMMFTDMISVIRYFRSFHVIFMNMLQIPEEFSDWMEPSLRLYQVHLKQMRYIRDMRASEEYCRTRFVVDGKI